jgi:hypothetical protein
MTHPRTNTAIQQPTVLSADITFADTSSGPLDDYVAKGRTVHLSGRVSTHNLFQMLQLLEVDDAVKSSHPTTAANLVSIAFLEQFRRHLVVIALAGAVHIQRVS